MNFFRNAHSTFDFIKPGPRLVFILVLLFSLSACSEVEELKKHVEKITKQSSHQAGGDPLKGFQTVKGWTERVPLPVIQAGDFRSKGLWNDPCVLKDKNGYVMYLTSSVGEPFKPPVVPFRAVSKDGKHWTLNPNKPLIDPTQTVFVSAETPNVVFFKGQYHMYFTGIYPPGKLPIMAIGHAVSKDGVNWKPDKMPILKSVADITAWNGYLVGEPGAVVHKGKVYLYFTAVGARPGGDPPQLQTIGLATSDDGRSFTNARSVFGQAEMYSPKKGFVGYSTPTAFLYKGKVHLVYDLAHFHKGRDPEWQQIGLHHAVSANGETGFVQDNKPLMTRNDYSWTSGEMLAPSVLMEGDKVNLWFSGHVTHGELAPLINRGFKGPEFGIGYASMTVDKLLANTGN